MARTMQTSRKSSGGSAAMHPEVDDDNDAVDKAEVCAECLLSMTPLSGSSALRASAGRCSIFDELRTVPRLEDCRQTLAGRSLFFP
jgi:predicted neuraminidase